MVLGKSSTYITFSTMSKGDRHIQNFFEDTKHTHRHSSKIKNAIKTAAAKTRNTVVVVPLSTMMAS
jgi:hypothetical protein